jgi:hypothetical protein
MDLYFVKHRSSFTLRDLRLSRLWRFEFFWIMTPCSVCGRIPTFRRSVLPTLSGCSLSSSLYSNLPLICTLTTWIDDISSWCYFLCWTQHLLLLCVCLFVCFCVYVLGGLHFSFEGDVIGRSVSVTWTRYVTVDTWIPHVFKRDEKPVLEWERE